MTYTKKRLLDFTIKVTDHKEKDEYNINSVILKDNSQIIRL